MYKRFFKRAIDFVFSLVGIFVFAVPMLIIAILIKIDSPGPVIFKQERIGLNGKVFEIYKFRTMCVGAELMGTGVYSSKGDNRVTRVGRVLRAASADELVQMINIFKGDMSFIGPRPPLTYHPWEYGEYTKDQKKMFDVRPGLTGYAQINGRKNVEWNKRIELNVWYVDNLSFLLDIKIFLMTILKVLTNGDNENEYTTVKKNVVFTHNEDES